MATSNIAELTTSGTLSDDSNIYAVKASSNITLTLPSIISDGMTYRLIRYDTTDNTVSLATTSPDLLYLNMGVTGVTGYDIVPLTDIEVQSLNDDWHVTSNCALERSESKTMFTTSFGIPSSVVSGTGSRVLISSFVYPGMTKEKITSVDVVINTGALGPSGTISLTNTGGSTTYGSKTFTASGSNQIVSISSISGLPSTKSLLEIGITIPVLTSVSVFSVYVK